MGLWVVCVLVVAIYVDIVCYDCVRFERLFCRLYGYLCLWFRNFRGV